MIEGESDVAHFDRLVQGPGFRVAILNAFDGAYRSKVRVRGNAREGGGEGVKGLGIRIEGLPRRGPPACLERARGSSGVGFTIRVQGLGSPMRSLPSCSACIRLCHEPVLIVLWLRLDGFGVRFKVRVFPKRMCIWFRVQSLGRRSQSSGLRIQGFCLKMQKRCERS